MIFLDHLFVILVGYFVLRIISSHFFVSQVVMTKIVSMFFIFQWIFFYYSLNFFLILMIHLSLLGIISLYFLMKHKWRKTQFRKGFPDILTSVILQMKIGKSFRSSLQSSMAMLPEYQKEILENIYQNVAFLPQDIDKKMTLRSCFNDVLFTEFLKIDRSKHKTIEKIENFRSRLINDNNFRRKSGRIRENIYVQVSIMGFFYVAAFVYVLMTMGFHKVQDILVGSLVMFVLGTLLSIFWGRKIKWSI